MVDEMPLTKADIIQPHGIESICVGCHWVWLEFGEPDFNWCGPMVDLAPVHFGEPSQEVLQAAQGVMQSYLASADKNIPLGMCRYYCKKE